MKFVFFLLMTFLAGCNASQPAKKTSEIHLDKNVLNNENTTSVWLAYGLALQVWKPVYLEDGSPDLFKREVYARKTVSKIWKEMKQDDAVKADPDLDALEQIMNAGYMAEYLWTYLKNDDWYNTGNLRLAEFEEWANENLSSHKPVTNTGVYVN